MDCRNLIKDTYDQIEGIFEGKKTYLEKPIITEENYYKSLYSPATLINDWMERRISGEKVETSTEPPMSEHMDQFRKPCATITPDRKELFMKLFESYGCGKEILLDHLGFSYYGNYASTYDLCYNHLPKGICGPFPRRYYRGKYIPTTDLTLIYGNLTQWGLKEKIYKNVNTRRTKEKVDISEAKAEYIQHDLAEVKKLNDSPSFKRVKPIY